MILSGQQIEHQSNGTSKLIDPFTLDNVRRSSYDLTIGDEYYCGHNGEKKSVALETQRLATSHTFSIPAHGVCFILCRETITLPDDISARVALRMSFIYQGLVLTAQPPFDPGYSGKVIVMLHNLSSSPVSVTQGDRLATIEFVKVDGKTLAKKPHRSVLSLAEQLKVPVIGSLTKIDELARKANKKVNNFAGQVIVIIGVLLVVPVAVNFLFYNLLTDKVSDLRSSITKLEQITDAQKKEIDGLKNYLAAGGAREKIGAIPSLQNPRKR